MFLLNEPADFWMSTIILTARSFHLPFDESLSSLVTLPHGREGDDLFMWKLCSLCCTQDSALLLWRHPEQFFLSSAFRLCHVFVQWPHWVPTILTSLFFWCVCLSLCHLNSLFSHPLFQDYVVLKLQWLRVTLGGWNGSRAEHYGGRTEGSGMAWCWALGLGHCLAALQATRAALELLTLVLSILAEHFLPVKIFNFLLQSQTKKKDFFFLIWGKKQQQQKTPPKTTGGRFRQSFTKLHNSSEKTLANSYL